MLEGEKTVLGMSHTPLRTFFQSEGNGIVEVGPSLAIVA